MSSVPEHVFEPTLHFRRRLWIRLWAVEHCLWRDGWDRWWHEEVAKVPSYCPPTIMSSEDPLFILCASPSLPPPSSLFRVRIDEWLDGQAQGH
ncbi:hypothetical protein C8R44DRAFT_813931, partial [Mycena epipterygia]